MITTNVIQRVFQIKLGDSIGTAFAVDHEEKQYLVTARHVVDNISNLSQISIYHQKQWKELPVEVVGLASNGIDIAVFSPKMQIAPTYPLPPSAAGLILGQQVFFLGFPLGIIGAGSELNRQFPVPLVKSGVLSGFDDEKKTKKFFIDGYNNRGFSGGPLIFMPQGEQEYRIAGVISGYLSSVLPLHDSHGNSIGTQPENSGITIAYGIHTVIDLANTNPIGFALTEDGVSKEDPES